MQSLYYLLGLGVGAGLVVQVGMNSTLRSLLGSPIVAALVSFLVGSLALAVYAGLARTPLTLHSSPPCRPGRGSAEYSAPSMSPQA
jgi:transporter family-2 protein